MYQSKVPTPTKAMTVRPIADSFPSDHHLRMAVTIAKTATKRRIDPKSALEFGAMTDQPHEPKLHAKPSRVRNSLNRSFDSTVEALAT